MDNLHEYDSKMYLRAFIDPRKMGISLQFYLYEK